MKIGWRKRRRRKKRCNCSRGGEEGKERERKIEGGRVEVQARKERERKDEEGRLEG